MFDRVLLLTDVSDNPELTFKPLAQIAKTCSSKVYIFHAMRGSSDLFYLEDEVRALIDKQARDRVEPPLLALQKQLKAEHDIDAEIVLRVGSFFDLAVAVLNELDIDLVVIPTEGHKEYTGRVIGSATAKIIRDSDVSVLTVNSSFAGYQERWHGFHRVVHPVDFSEGGAEALRASEDFCAEFGGRLEVAHVIQPIHQQVLETPEGQVLLPKDMQYQIRSKQEARLSDIAHTITRVPAAWKLIEDNKPGSGIMAWADRSEVDLIVVPPVGHDSTRNTVLGSVAEHVIKHARSPVLTLKSKPSSS